MRRAAAIVVAVTRATRPQQPYSRCVRFSAGACSYSTSQTLLSASTSTAAPPPPPPPAAASVPQPWRAPSPLSPHVCTDCLKVFDSDTQLQSHRTRIHLKPFQCSHCSKRYSHAHTLRLHVERHELGPDLHRCHMCQMSFATANTLRIHNLWRHSGGLKADWPCDYDGCGKRFRSKATLESHRVTHTRELRFQCPECHTRFPHRSGPSWHLRYGKCPKSQASPPPTATNNDTAIDSD